MVIEEFDDAVRVTRPNELIQCNIKTMPHPGFDDMQPPAAVLLSIADGTSILRKAFGITASTALTSLRRMGVQVQVTARSPLYKVKYLPVAPVKATDLVAVWRSSPTFSARGVTEVEETAISNADMRILLGN